MFIKDMFVKDIGRDLQGVVKVGQDDSKVKQIELEEYVVTGELFRHFRDFYTSYNKGIKGNTDKVGIWISGFFGSGKSHFLKILSYLIENIEVEGKKAMDYFIEDNKIKDPMLLADIKLAASVPTDVVLFNIDSKSETSGKKDKDTILNVFLKVFNEKVGYSTNPHVADLERHIDKEGLYTMFKEKYKELSGDDWIETRHKFNFFKGRVVKTLAAMGYMDAETANDWAKGTIKPYETSIENFVAMVDEYLKSKGENHRIIFLVDEVGQYIGENTDLMLNLQTITEDLGTVCRGRAWVAVTSQQDIDAILEVVGRDFSKITGRFDTRLSLTSANVDDVIKLRILKKNETSKETLTALYEIKETIIRNLLVFKDEVEKKLYEDKRDFYEVYPFIPYQFNMLADVLTSIRKHGASGKHLSEGERSMLALFKEGAERFKESQEGTLIPFYIFYDALNRFLDHSHAVVITRALDNSIINPDKENDNFNVNVLKVLFLIKYIEGIKANSDNITTLMISNINDDRRAVKEKVEEALKVLENQALIQKNGEIYIFLTDEEQDINRSIKNQDVETIDVIKKVSELIFEDIFSDDKIKVPGYKNKNLLGFNREVDGLPYKANQTFDFGVKVITPYSELSGQDSNLKMLSSSDRDVYVELPNDASFLKELHQAMKIEKFLSTPTSNMFPKFEEIKTSKKSERNEYWNRAKNYLYDSLKASKFYVNGGLVELGTKDFKYNLIECLNRLIAVVYHKLSYMTNPMEEIDIYQLFKKKDKGQIALDDGTIPNENAISEVLGYIRGRTKNHTKISLKEIENKFIKAPYGFLEIDIEWIVAHLFKEGLIGFTISGSQITLLNETIEKVVDYIIKKQYAEKLLLEIKEIIPEYLKKILKNVAKEVFKTNNVTDDGDTMVMQFNKEAAEMAEGLKDRLQEYNYGQYPGKDILKDGYKLIEKTTHMDKSKDILQFIRENEDDYLDFAKYYPTIKSFLDGDQKKIWNKTQSYMEIFDESKSYIINGDIENITKKIKNILNMPWPYDNISELSGLNFDFSKIYTEILEKESEPVKEEIKKAEGRVMEVLEQTNLKEVFLIRFKKAFDELIGKVKSCNNVAKINGFKIEADKLKIRFLDEIVKEQQRRAKEEAEKTDDEGNKPKDKIIIKKQKNLSIKDINLTKSWQIETKEDIYKYLESLKNKLEKEIEENTILNIEF